jgi:hypothetical protein
MRLNHTAQGLILFTLLAIIECVALSYLISRSNINTWIDRDQNGYTYEVRHGG